MNQYVIDNIKWLIILSLTFGIPALIRFVIVDSKVRFLLHRDREVKKQFAKIEKEFYIDLKEVKEILHRIDIEITKIVTRGEKNENKNNTTS